MNIVKVPTSLGSMNKNKGCEKAPDKIIKELKSIEVNESLREIRFEVSEIKTSSDLDETNRNIENAKGDIFIGGDHSITYSLFKSLSSKNKALIIFDAHVDLDNYTDTPTHEDFLRKLIDESHLNPENLVIVGARKIWENELNYIKEKNIRVITPKQLLETGMEDICDAVMENFRHFDELYISIDMDVLDPSAAPGTYYTEPNGLQLSQLLYFLRRLKLLRNIKKIDLVEVNPDIENKITTKTAAKIIAELI